MRKICLILSMVVIAACSKNNNEENSLTSLSGTWVEASQRLDTIVFNYNSAAWSWPATEKVLSLKAKPFEDPIVGTGFLNIADLYKYKVKGDSINVVAFSSSLGLYRPYAIKRTSSTTISIGKFYFRSSLPDNLTFVRVQ